MGTEVGSKGYKMEKPKAYDGDKKYLNLYRGHKTILKPIRLFLLVLQGPEGVLETICQDFQLLCQLVLLTKLLTQQHQVTGGVV